MEAKTNGTPILMFLIHKSEYNGGLKEQILENRHAIIRPRLSQSD